MPAAWIGAGAAVLGAGSSILASPSTSGGGSSLYVPTGLGSTDTDWQSLLSGIYGNYNSTNLGQYGMESLLNGLTSNSQYMGGYMNAANAAGQGYTNAGTALTGLGNLDLSTQQTLLNAGQQVYQNSLDPNQAQYNLSLNNLTQQTGATNSMYGLGSSAAGAGVQDQALSNFGINWNTQQLQNQIAGLGAYGSIANTAGNYGQAGATALADAPQFTLAGGQLPYSTSAALAAVPGQLGSTYGSYLNSNVYNPAEGIMSTAQNYLNPAMGQSATAFNAANQSAGALGSSVASALGGIGNSVQNAGGFANLFNGTTGSYGSGDFSGAFTSSPYYSGGGNSYGFTMQ